MGPVHPELNIGPSFVGACHRAGHATGRHDWDDGRSPCANDIKHGPEQSVWSFGSCQILVSWADSVHFFHGARVDMTEVMLVTTIECSRIQMSRQVTRVHCGRPLSHQKDPGVPVVVTHRHRDPNSFWASRNPMFNSAPFGSKHVFDQRQLPKHCMAY